MTKKKTLIEEYLPLMEQEKQAFWPLYDDYMKEIVKLLELMWVYRASVTKKFHLKNAFYPPS